MKQQSIKEQLVNAALVIIGNPLVFVCALPMLIFRSSILAAVIEIVVLAVHAAVSVLSCRRLKQRYGISPGKFILYSAVPAFVINIFLSFASLSIFEGVLPLVVTYIFGGYALVYTAILAAAVIEKENDRA